MLEITQFNIHTRIADDRFVLGARLLSISQIMDAIDVPRMMAICFSVSINSGSRVILVWWPDNETDNFFIL